MSELIEIEHNSVGTISIRPEAVIHFDHIPGFEDARRFVVVGVEETTAYAWLVCLDDLDLAFRVTEPDGFFPDYDPLSGSGHDSVFEGAAREDLVVLAIINLSGNVPCLNLAAPLVVDIKRRVGRQVVFEDERFGLRVPVPVPAKPSSPATQIESKPQT